VPGPTDTGQATRYDDEDAMATRQVEGCYDPAYEHDACGVAFVADLRRPGSHEIVDLGLRALENLAHRGAFGADPETGDGAGILLQIPHDLYAEVAGCELPAPGSYGTGIAMTPDDDVAAKEARALVGEVAAEEGLEILGWRKVPIELDAAGEGARRAVPRFEQVFATASSPIGADALERRLYVVRKRVEHLSPEVYFPSLSSRTVVYKGMLASRQLRAFFPDLKDERCKSPLPLFDEHIPVLAPCAPLQVRGPQRRDQHGHW